MNHDTELVVREGDNVTLGCEAQGHPRPHVVWRREDGEDIMVKGRKAAMIENPMLLIGKVSRLHMGMYLCVASNGIDPTASRKYEIKVQCECQKKVFIFTTLPEMCCINFPVPPMFWIPSQLEGAYAGQDVTLECHSEAFPKSINYWVKENGSMLNTGKQLGGFSASLFSPK